MIKKGYFGNGSLSLAWDRIKVHQIAPFNITEVASAIDLNFGNTVKVLRNFGNA